MRARKAQRTEREEVRPGESCLDENGGGRSLIKWEVWMDTYLRATYRTRRGGEAGEIEITERTQRRGNREIEGTKRADAREGGEGDGGTFRRKVISSVRYFR